MLQMHVLRLKIRYVIMAYLVMSWISLYFFESSHPWIFESWSTYHIAEMYMLAGGLKEIRLEQSDLMLATFVLRLWIVYARGPSFSPTCCPLLTTFLSRYYINRFHKSFHCFIFSWIFGPFDFVVDFVWFRIVIHYFGFTMIILSYVLLVSSCTLCLCGMVGMTTFPKLLAHRGLLPKKKNIGLSVNTWRVFNLKHYPNFFIRH